MTDPDKKTDENTDNSNSEAQASAAGSPPPPPPSPDPTTPPPAASAPENPPAPGELAGMGPRILAVIIDGLIFSAFSWLRLGGLGYLLGLAYLVTRDALPFLDGQSVGKKAMKLRAVKADTGTPLTNDWQASILRNIILVIPVVGALIELIVVLTNDKKQRLGDQWAKTKVVVDPS